MIVRCVLTMGGEVRQCAVKQSVRFMDNAVVETLREAPLHPGHCSRADPSRSTTPSGFA